MSTRNGIVCALAAAGFLGVTLDARADADTDVTLSGPYVGVGWGHFDLKLDNLNDVGTAVSGITHSGDDAWKVDLGYRFSPYIGLEADYMNFGHPGDMFEGTGSNGNYALHMSGFAPFIVATLPAGPFELFAKAGYLYYNEDLRVNFNAPGEAPLESSHSRSDFLYGGGLGVTFFQHLNVNAEYDVVRVVNAPNSNALWLATAWRF